MRVKSYHILTILLVFLMVLSCEEKEKNTSHPIAKNKHEVTSLDHTFCSGKFVPDEMETIRLRAIEGNALEFIHNNVVFTCGLEEIRCRIDENSHDTVNITEVSIGVETDCVCPYDVTLEISEFIVGGLYHFNINKTFERISPRSHYSFDVRYHNDLDTTFVVGVVDLKK